MEKWKKKFDFRKSIITIEGKGFGDEGVTLLSSQNTNDIQWLNLGNVIAIEG
jgi:hypothetical protein